MAGDVGGRRGKRQADGGEKRARNLMRGHAQSDAVEPRTRQSADRDVRRDRQDKRQRTGPKGTRQSLRVFGENALPLRRRQILDMRDERIERRAPFCGIEFRDGFIRCRIGAKAIDRLGRKGDEPAGTKNCCRFRDRLGIGGAASCWEWGKTVPPFMELWRMR